LIGISSQNYIYIYFILIGFSFAGYVKFDVLGRRSKSKSHALLWTLTIVLVMFPIGIQLKDYSTRAHISSVTKQINVIDPSSKSDFALLLVLLKDMDDAAYRELLARNFYTVGACSFGDDVYRMMTETNTNEVRLEALTALRLNCKQI
jgi:hypothetical protein